MNRKKHLPADFGQIVIVGVGGTGSYLAQGLAKMIGGYPLDHAVTLVDPDIVEEKNCARQNFHPWEIGQPKAEALAFRLNQQYGLAFAHQVGKGEDLINPGYNAVWKPRLIITCVDTIEARKPYKDAAAWLDLGNGQETGQALYGTTAERKRLKGELKEWEKTPYVQQLPNAYVLADMGRRRKTAQAAPSCADHPFAEQGVFANEWAAGAGLIILHQLLVKGELSTPAIYFDTARGRMTPAFIDREYLNP